MTQENLPAIPETPVQQARYDRVIAAATEVLSAGGQEAVQMKDLAQRAGVSLATLYRYFPVEGLRAARRGAVQVPGGLAAGVRGGAAGRHRP